MALNLRYLTYRSNQDFLLQMQLLATNAGKRICRFQFLGAKLAVWRFLCLHGLKLGFYRVRLVRARQHWREIRHQLIKHMR